MKEHYLIICNPKAGKGRSGHVLSKFEEFLRTKRIGFETAHGDLPANLEPFSSLVIIGGDGTLNYVLNHYREINIPIGILKGGTGNDYARLHLGDDHPNEQDFETVTGQSMVAVDAGMVNNRIFINGLGIGFDGWVVKRALGKHIFSGMMAYYSTILSLLLFYRESEVTVETPEKQWNQNMFMISVAKGKTYGGGFRVAPKADPTDKAFDLITISSIPLLNRFRYLPVIEKGKHLDFPFVQFLKTGSVKVRSGTKLQAHIDGEWFEASEFDIKLLPSHYRIKSRNY